MADPFLGEIKVFPFGFAPRGWALCNGQLLPINQNQALFALLGTTYGGDGRVSFALPDLRARTPIHVGSGHVLGERGGEATHTLSAGELPQHTHPVQASSSAGNDPGSSAGPLVLASPLNASYRPPAALVTMAAASVTTVGGGQPHLNLQPYLVLTICIALQGIFPSQS